MQRSLSLLVIIALGAATVLFPVRASDAPSPEYRPGELIVSFREGTEDRFIERELRRMGALRAERGLSGRRYLATLDGSMTVPEAVRELAAMPEVAYAEPNAIVRLTQAQRFVPNDPSYARLQWNLRTIDAERVWAIQKGSPQVAIAVIDTGIAYEDYTDPRTGQVFRKAPDWGALSFLPGFDFINRDSHPNDDEGHGTHVAGTIAEATNNGIAVAGIAFGCALMPLKSFDANGAGNSFAIAEAIDYAASFSESGNRPVKVINMSFGSESASSRAVEDAVNRAFGSGIVLVGAAGNDNRRRVHYPGALPNVIAVAALDRRKEKASYSNFGPEVSLSAPGGDCRRDDDADGVLDCVWQVDMDFRLVPQGRYDVFIIVGSAGTSQATPHVSASAALLISQGITDPTAVRSALESTAEDLGPPGRDETFGFGLVRPVPALTGLGLNR